AGIEPAAPPCPLLLLWKFLPTSFTVNTPSQVCMLLHLFMTFIVNGLDAFVVYECEGKVYVNLNDALNASHWSFIHQRCCKVQRLH
ncbi:MAG: hypothetical protein RLZZ152_1547, partial [Pseudomonadota bacterium]